MTTLADLTFLVPGAAGGLVWLLYSWHKGRCKKCSMTRVLSPIICGAVLGSLIRLPMIPIPHDTLAFCIGLSWEKIVEAILSHGYKELGRIAAAVKFWVNYKP